MKNLLWRIIKLKLQSLCLEWQWTDQNASKVDDAVCRIRSCIAYTGNLYASIPRPLCSIVGIGGLRNSNNSR